MAYYINTYPIVPYTNACVQSSYHLGWSAGQAMGGAATMNTFVGQRAGFSTTGSDNTFIGRFAGCCGCAGAGNVVAGMNAYCGNISGDNNVVIGHLASQGDAGSNCHRGNVYLGAFSGRLGSLKFDNVGVGYCSLTGPCTSPTCSNIAIGLCSGACIGHCWNVVIGGSLASGLTTSDNLIIADAVGTCYMYGDRNGNIGVGNTSPAVRLHATGAIFATNEIIAYFSDRRLKENIIVIDCALDKVNSLNAIYYTPNKLAQELGFESNKKEVGLFADEVEDVAPEVVALAPFDLDIDKKSKSGNNYKTVKYERLVPLLVEAIKELNILVDDLEKEIHAFGGN